jgi:hypothetical protein
MSATTASARAIRAGRAPEHASWLNIIEQWLGVLTRRLLRRAAIDREPVSGMHRGLGDHPRPGAAVRPGRGVHDKRMAQEHVPGRAGGVRDRKA